MRLTPGFQALNLKACAPTAVIRQLPPCSDTCTPRPVTSPPPSQQCAAAWQVPLHSCSAMPPKAQKDVYYAQDERTTNTLVDCKGVATLLCGKLDQIETLHTCCTNEEIYRALQAACREAGCSLLMDKTLMPLSHLASWRQADLVAELKQYCNTISLHKHAYSPDQPVEVVLLQAYRDGVSNPISVANRIMSEAVAKVRWSWQLW